MLNKIDPFHNQGLTPQNNPAVRAAHGWVKTQDAHRQVKYAFAPHYHPYTDDFIEKLNRDGLEALLDVGFQDELDKKGSGLLETLYSLTPEAIMTPEELDMSDAGPYAIYNWELFFHAPMAIAVHLSKNQRFAEAQRWFHFIFDPTSNDPVTDPANPQQPFWKFLLFRKETRADFIDEMLTELAEGDDPDLRRKINVSIQAWRDHPFQPHVVARGRFLAYQMNVVMKYLDNLIAWGDSLFRQDTIEAINEATQLYVLAGNILGPKPQAVPPRGKAAHRTYAQLKNKLDAFGNALVEMENELPFNSMPARRRAADEGATNALFGIAQTLYFCIPQNDKLLGYWDTVADRLFKIRHCMNIEGTVRQLPLFEPPIDPGLLMKAAAAGLDIGSIVSSLGQPVSPVRSALLLQKAMEICAELKSLGAALLSAYEKGEAEHLTVMRQQHEVNLMALAKDVKFLQWKEAEAATEALLSSRATVFERYRHYQRILGKKGEEMGALQDIVITRESLTEENFDTVYASMAGSYAQQVAQEAYRQENSVGGIMEFAGNIVTAIVGGELGKTLPLNKNEHAELNVFLPTHDFFSEASMILTAAAELLKFVPQFDAHLTPIGVGAKTGFGGVQLSGAAEQGALASQKIANAFAMSAERASKMASYYRRAEDYVLQNNLAASELTQMGRQIISSLIREQILQKEYENHEKQMEQSAAVQDFLEKEKFANEDLYTWMSGELSKVYFECYKFAFDLARRTEQVMKYELMRPEFDGQNFIKFGYWDDGRKGLLSGEMLYLDLKRLEMAYHEHNRREYELTKHISLQRLDPVALLRLKTTGVCDIAVPEWLFDLDTPGQYMRRIKNVALSIPCVAGPYTGIHCKLSLLSSSIRISAQGGDYARNLSGEDTRFRDFQGAIQSIVTSSGQNDTGLFETNLRDERYLPFEGAGVIGNWRLELTQDIPTFDWNTISDVILHLRYSAREAGNLRQGARETVLAALAEGEGRPFLLSLQHEFPEAWHRFVTENDLDHKQFDLRISRTQLPYWTSGLAVGENLPLLLCAVDVKSRRLLFSQAAQAHQSGEPGNWELMINNESPLFGFINDHVKQPLYVILGIQILQTTTP